MKKLFIFFTTLIVLSLSWMAFVREPLPPIPVICAEISDEVDLGFSINTMDLNGLELSLNNKVDGKGMFVHFKMANSWKTGRAGLVVDGVRTKSDFRGGMKPEKYLDEQKKRGKSGKDFSDFMKDKKGKKVDSYTFSQALVEDGNGQTFMRMVYDGPEMEMIQTLEIPRPITIPAHISRKFTQEGIIQFQPGTVALDKKIGGFYIPVKIR